MLSILYAVNVGIFGKRFEAVKGLECFDPPARNTNVSLATPCSHRYVLRSLFTEPTQTFAARRCGSGEKRGKKMTLRNEKRVGAQKPDHIIRHKLQFWGELTRVHFIRGSSTWHIVHIPNRPPEQLTIKHAINCNPHHKSIINFFHQHPQIFGLWILKWCLRVALQ